MSGTYPLQHFFSTLSCCLFTFFLFFTDAQLVATLMLQLFPQRLEWCLCCRHRRARGEHSERMMHGRLLSDALIFFPRVEILLRSPLPVLQLSGCDKLMAPGATAACWESQQHWRMFTSWKSGFFPEICALEFLMYVKVYVRPRLFILIWSSIILCFVFVFVFLTEAHVLSFCESSFPPLF